jgi:hypothetical protein
MLVNKSGYSGRKACFGIMTFSEANSLACQYMTVIAQVNE